MSCRQAREYLEELIMGDLNTSLAEIVMQHLAVCPDCQKAYDEQRRLIELLRTFYRRSKEQKTSVEAVPPL
ncbi:MAG: zf-HC2 domain-containing protein [Fimbriimonadia bacterium]|nr:zf-HC2 domain-containing protein [Fimbriimonadia bacterium]